MKSLIILQAIISILLIVSILLQNRGSGLGLAYGDSFGGYYTKRGMEKFLLFLSSGLGVAFLGVSLVIFMLGQ